jgi:hypothetical protein
MDSALDPIAIAAIVFLCVFSGAIVGMILHVRLPTEHLDGGSVDVVKLVMGLIGTMAALVLGLLIAFAKGNYDTQRNYVVELSADIVELDRVLAYYGPETKEARDQFRRAVIGGIQRIWPKDTAKSPILEPREKMAPGEDFYESIQMLSPKTSVQQYAQNRAMSLGEGLLHTRTMMSGQLAGSISLPFLMVLVSWLVLLFVGFGMLARFNGTVITALLTGALSVAGAIFLILEMNEPYGGLMRISSAPVRSAVMQIDQ